MAHGNYRAMLRNKMRIRLKSTDFSPAIYDYLKSHPSTVEAFINSDRLVVLFSLMINEEAIPLTYDNILFLINRIDICDDGLAALESAEIKAAIDRLLNS